MPDWDRLLLQISTVLVSPNILPVWSNTWQRPTLIANIFVGWFFKLEFHEPKSRRSVGHKQSPGRGIAVSVRGNVGVRREVDMGKKCAA